MGPSYLIRKALLFASPCLIEAGEAEAGVVGQRAAREAPSAVQDRLAGVLTGGEGLAYRRLHVGRGLMISPIRQPAASTSD